MICTKRTCRAALLLMLPNNSHACFRFSDMKKGVPAVDNPHDTPNTAAKEPVSRQIMKSTGCAAVRAATQPAFAFSWKKGGSYLSFLRERTDLSPKLLIRVHFGVATGKASTTGRTTLPRAPPGSQDCLRLRDAGWISCH